MGILAPSYEIKWLPLLCVLLSIYVGRKVWVYARLRHISGPLWAGFTDWPHHKAMFQSNCHEWYAAITEKHGSLARVAPNVLMTSSPDVWAHVTNKPGYKRSSWLFSALRSEHRRDSIFTQTDNDKHEYRKKQLGPAVCCANPNSSESANKGHEVSGRETANIEICINESLQELISLIRLNYLSSNAEIVPMDLTKKLQYFLLDSTSSAALGKAFGNLQSDMDIEGYIKSTEQGFLSGTTALALGFGWLAHVPLIGHFFLPSPKDDAGFGRYMAACFSHIDERLANPTDERSDMLATFIRNRLTGDDLRTEILIFMTVGAITPLGALSGTLLHVISHARVYAVLQREIDDAVRHGKAPRASGGLITSAQARQLPYLQATIREAMRFWPPVVGLFPRDVPPGGDTILVDGKPVFLPGGVCIGRSVCAMYRSKEIYGKDADCFRPERWLEPDEDKLASMIRTNEMLFNHGKTQCLGKAITQMEMGKTLFELLRNFQLALINPTRPWSTINTLGLFMISDMWVQVMERDTGRP